jgi:hypothetical protein
MTHKQIALILWDLLTKQRGNSIEKIVIPYRVGSEKYDFNEVVFTYKDMLKMVKQKYPKKLNKLNIKYGKKT